MPSTSFEKENASLLCKHYAVMYDQDQTLAQRSIPSDMGAEQLLQINKLIGKIQERSLHSTVLRMKRQDGIINGSKLKG